MLPTLTNFGKPFFINYNLQVLNGIQLKTYRQISEYVPMSWLYAKSKISINFYARLVSHHILILEFDIFYSYWRYNVNFFQSMTLTGKSLFPCENYVNENVHFSPLSIVLSLGEVLLKINWIRQLNHYNS